MPVRTSKAESNAGAAVAIRSAAAASSGAETRVCASRPFFRSSFPKVIRSFPTLAQLLLVATLIAYTAPVAFAQAREGIMSEREIDTLRDTAFVPSDRLAAYEQILDTREKQIEELVRKTHHVTYGRDLHDYMDQFAAIVDELNDNLEDYRDKHRDIRKVLPKLIQATERWSTALRSPEENESYKIVRRLALDGLKDTRELAEGLQTSQAEYFKAHPEAAKAEKDRTANPHAPGADGP